MAAEGRVFEPLLRLKKKEKEAFSPRKMAAAVAGDKPPRLNATPARVRTHFTIERENTGSLKNRERENGKAGRSLSDVQFFA